MFSMVCELIFAHIFVFNLVIGTFQIEKGILISESTSFSSNSSHKFEYLKRYTRQASQRCQIPYFSLQTEYKIVSDPNTEYELGDYVNNYNVLQISCDQGYKLNPLAQDHSTCVDGEWTTPLKNCLRSCPSLKSVISTTVTCRWSDGEGNEILLKNCINPVNGTTASLSCNPLYEEAGIEKNPNRICRNGRWDPFIPQCTPICGVKSPKGIPNIINGTNTEPGEYPWQVGVYNIQKNLICGGTLLDYRIILSAAHCFTDYYGNIHPVENYFIASGKYYRQYSDDRDTYAQYSNVQKIIIPERYKGLDIFQGDDIAIVVLKETFQMTLHVLPICIELNEHSTSLELSKDRIGFVTGWGYTQRGTDLSDVLKEVEIPFIPFQECFDAVPSNFKRFISYDKICGGYLKRGTSVCGGDSGGGLLFKKSNSDRHYIKGIVSVSPALDGVCDSDQYSLFTAVFKHIEFVRKYVLYYQTLQPLECERDDCSNSETENSKLCRLPLTSSNGTYTILNNNDTYEPGGYVSPNSILSLICKPGFKLLYQNYTSELFTCSDKGVWTPELVECINATLSEAYSRRLDNINDDCETPDHLPNSVYKILSQEKYKPGDYVPHYSILEVTCDPGYALPPMSQKISLCVDGYWNELPSPCLRSCPSLKSIMSTTVKCIYDNTSLSNCMHPVDGTIANLSCNEFYAGVIRDHSSLVCFRGRWSSALPVCFPTCGKYTPKEKFNVINGENSTFIDFYPWRTEIYTNAEKFICTGSVITPNIILSVAHCFSDNDGMIQPIDNYIIAVGKYYSDFRDNRDKFAQYSTVRKIYVPERYRGLAGYYSFDVAVVVLETSFILNVGVQPVCVDIGGAHDDQNILMNNRGTITGWAYNLDSEFTSDVLKELTVEYIPFEKCYNEAPANFRRYITYDKICGIRSDFINTNQRILSGSGLLFDISDHYYLTALASSGFTEKQFDLYTSIKAHIDFIRNIVTLNREEEQSIECEFDDCTNNEKPKNNDSCLLPNFPLHGNYSLLKSNSSTYEPGHYVNVSNVLLLSCDNGYEANPPLSTQFLCAYNGQWTPAVGTCTQISTNTSGCTTPDSHIGKCVLIRECQSMLDFLEQPTTIHEIPRTLEKYQCDIAKNSLKVCCPDKPITIKVPSGNGEIILPTPDVTSAVTLNNVEPPPENFSGAPILFANVFSANQIYMLEVDRKPNETDNGPDDHIRKR